MLRLLLLLVALCTPAQGEEVIAGLSQSQISISTNFDGSAILIFGAVKRETAIAHDSELGVIVTIAGPRQPLTVRRKDKVALIWVNTDSVEIDAAPSFYSISTTAPLDDILSSTSDLRHSVSIPRAIRSVGAASAGRDVESFTEAVIRIRKAENLYQINEGTVTLTEDTLFSTSVNLPANLVEGNYTARVLLTRDKTVINEFDTAIYVEKIGLERFLHNLAHEQPVIYGLLSLAIAMFAGWGASAVFRYIRT